MYETRPETNADEMRRTDADEMHREIKCIERGCVLHHTCDINISNLNVNQRFRKQTHEPKQTRQNVLTKKETDNKGGIMDCSPWTVMVVQLRTLTRRKAGGWASRDGAQCGHDQGA